MSEVRKKNCFILHSQIFILILDLPKQIYLPATVANLKQDVSKKSRLNGSGAEDISRSGILVSASVQCETVQDDVRLS